MTASLTLSAMSSLFRDTLGIAAATTAPAYASLILQNHSEPLTHALPTR